ncbi:hypothetical protein BZZ01_09670 [Nostocales cyanobacterium HT-58-2]|nr:hypothetical protein BZZ01_09670 [Nostocales cyanobacterium HT-58-2]
MPQLASLSFDVTLEELLPVWLSGATVVLPEQRWLGTIADLEQLIQTHQLTTLEMTTAYWHEWVYQLCATQKRPPDCLRFVLMGGEQVLPERVASWQEFNIPLVHVYGLTETTITSLVYKLTPGLQQQLVQLPLGRPLANTQVYILDQHLQLLPIGVPGELYIGGDGLTRGYFNRPDLTAEKFLPNPWSAQVGARLYRTGDLARYSSQGNIEFLGRIDQQVKLRGFRVEVGEIEALLAQHPLVRDNVVLLREDVPGDKRLVAYVIAEQQSSPSTHQLRQFLQQLLPDYMLPSAFVFVQALPLTPNGKIDRPALPVPDSIRPQEVAYIAPHTSTEIMVAGLYAQVLGVNQVGRYDNFFELGGHSLLGTQLISRVSQAFQVELPLRYLFEKPTVASLAECIETTLFTESSLQVPSMVPVARDKELFLSFAQQRLWFMNQLQPNIPFYNVPAKVHINGILNIRALQQSLNEIVQRHEVLRTSFLTVQGQPVQKIASQLDLALPVIDLQALLEPQQQLEVLRLTLEEAKQSFKLDSNLLLQTKLLQLDSQKYIFLLTMHHIVSDAWSIEILIRELSKLYQAFCDGKASPLSPLSIQYADFAVWQRQWLQGEVLENQLHYWKQQLNGASPLLELPGDRPRPATQTYRGATQSFVLPADLFKTLQQLSRQENVTLFMSVLAAFKVLLYRYTGEDDIIVGSPIAARNRREIEELIGFFINSLVLRTDLSGNPSFRQLLGRVREVTLGAYAHQDLPFEKLVEELQPERDLSYNPLFQVLFDLQNTPMSILELPNLTIELLEVDLGTVRCDLELHCQENSKGFEGILVYNTDLFDAATITQMLENFQTLLKDIVTHPDKSISDLSLLNPHQKQLLVEWNKTQTQYPQDQCIHQLFQAQVEKTPDAVALFFEQQQLSYGELNARANQLAHHLQALGVGPEVLVGLCVERSLEMVIGVLGILKAGGAYVPLDPTYPQERLAFMLEDSQVPILLTQQQLVEELPTFWTQIICLDADWEIIENNSKDNLIHKVDPENLAYIIYTSGSTGKPKGVQIQHQSLCNLSKAQIQTFNVEPHSCVLQFASLSFDASVSEIVMAVCSGAKLCLSKADTLLPGKGLLELLEQQAITHMTLPPSVLATLPIEELQTSTRAIIVAGEACSLDLAQRVAKGNRFFNGYGPTETTVCATIAHGINNYHKLTIGRAIANAQVYILDEHLQSVPIGVPGELYIGGVPLARGYFNQPQLTAEKFIPHPLCQQAGARLYKTGDQARYLGDGEIEFLGRIDQQVKIRGFRIELGEIEAVLAQHPHIQQAVVIVREDQPGDKRLVAYVLADQENTLTTTELRHFLTQKLPEYMVPSAFVLLNTLPLTSSSKIDRNALPTPDLSRSSLDIGFVTPSTPTEQVLATIWAEVLGLKQVSIHDNFFELGGHSLLATQVISQIRKFLLIEIPLRSLFEQPTIARLSKYINNARGEHQSLSLPPIRPVPRNTDLPLSFAQQRLWFLDQLETGSASYNIPATLRLDGLLNVPAFQMALQEIVWRHEALRTTFPMVNGAPVQVIASKPTLLFSLIDLQQLSEEQQLIEVQHLATKEAQQPFDLASGPLLRVTLLCLSPKTHVLLLTMHHIVSDAWSTGVFINELTTLYTSCCQKKVSPLPELPIQYADFAVWQRQWLQGEVLQTQLNYWKEKLAGAPPVLELPIDRPRPAVQKYQGATQSLVLPLELSEALKALSQRENVTLFMTLLAAFNVLLYRYTGQDDILVGSPIAGRNYSEIEGLIGFFVNTLVLRTKVTTDLSFKDLLEQVREVALRAYAHPDLPFEKLVEELQPERNLSYTPLFQVMFALQNLPTELFNTLGLKSSLLEVDNLRAKFDLTLTIQEMKQGLTGALEYNTDLFDAASITRMLGHLQTLLEDIVAHPTKRLSDVCILSEAEQYQLLSEWNDNQVKYPQDKCIHQLFEAQVEQTPDAVAVVFEDQQLTYRELNTHANQLAHHLQSLGVEPDVLVGVYVERSTEMVIGLLGILKAGGAYVPLDPAYPEERLAFMLEDAQIEVLVTTKKLVAKLPSKKVKTKVVDLHYDWAKITRTDNPCSNVTASNLAYVIYTSGSTGIPKGAMNSHQGLCNRLLWMQETYQLVSKDRILQKTPFSFDVSVWEIFWPLLSGTCLVLSQPEGHKDSAYLVKLIAAQQITTLHFVPSMLQVFLEEQELETCSCLRRVFCSGEALPYELQERFFERLGCELYNLYGPTEAAIDVTFWTCKQEINQLIVPIGRPIANTQIYLLDAEFQPVPIGVPGELYIGGTPLARGYLNRPDLTAQKFIPNPLSQEAGSRLYKTGDLARYQVDGNIEFLSRIDEQVKIRGFRIELGEIEAVLGQHPHIQANVVVAREDQPGDKRLVAYLVADQKSVSSISNLRRFLQQKLPEFMVPSAFVFLEELPLSPNGKVDRKALPAPELVRPELQTVYVAPQNQMERTIATIWQESLQIETVGIHDNFFDLGGHSLLIVQVHNKLNKTFKTNLSLLKMFQYPTISSLAEYLSQINTSKDSYEKNDERSDKIQEGKVRLKKRLKQKH